MKKKHDKNKMQRYRNDFELKWSTKVHKSLKDYRRDTADEEIEEGIGEYESEYSIDEDE
jgi:hypothetical protein